MAKFKEPKRGKWVVDVYLKDGSRFLDIEVSGKYDLMQQLEKINTVREDAIIPIGECLVIRAGDFDNCRMRFIEEKEEEPENE